MPTFEYLCACGKVTEQRRLVHDRNEPARCECGEIAERIMSVPQRPLNTGTPIHHRRG